jgi:hypothetical protein
MLYTLFGSYLFLQDENNVILQLYYDYIIKLLWSIVVKQETKYNFIIGDTNYSFHNSNKTIRLGVNSEHTLVKKGGRSIPLNCIVGKIKTINSYDSHIEEDDTYLVRIVNMDNLLKADYVIDYSLPNIHNIRKSECQEYVDFSKKVLYISPLLFENVPFLEHRKNVFPKNDVITTFVNIHEPRRKKLYDLLLITNLYYKNINNCFGYEEIKNLYLDTRVMINIHQTDHHHSFEELRVLPALQCGVIVISERSPLYDNVPYHEMVIWCDYHDIISTTRDVLLNYEYYYHKIFIEKGAIIKGLHQKNVENIERILT